MTATDHRWTADVKMEAGTNGTEYAVWLYDCGTYIGKPVRGSQEKCESFAAIVNGPDLPPNVELHRDGTLWALGRDIPDGWEWRQGEEGWTAKGKPPFAWRFYEVRPPQTPQTVRVPHTESVGRISKRFGRPIDSYHGNGTERWVIVGDTSGTVRENAAADGGVEVLA